MLRQISPIGQTTTTPAKYLPHRTEFGNIFVLRDLTECINRRERVGYTYM